MTHTHMEWRRRQRHDEHQCTGTPCTIYARFILNFPQRHTAALPHVSGTSESLFFLFAECGGDFISNPIRHIIITITMRCVWKGILLSAQDSCETIPPISGSTIPHTRNGHPPCVCTTWDVCRRVCVCAVLIGQYLECHYIFRMQYVPSKIYTIYYKLSAKPTQICCELPE